MDRKSRINSFCIFLGLGLLMLVYFFLVPSGIGDDGWFMAQTMPILDFAAWRYSAWSSRVIIEALMLLFCRLPLTAARLLMSAAASLAAFGIWRVFTDRTERAALNVCSLLLLFGAFGGDLSEQYFTALTHTGFIATTFNYLLPCTCGILCLIPLKMMSEGAHFRWYHWFIFSPLVLIAANQEQVAAILSVVYLLFVLHALGKKKVRALPVFLCLLAVASLAFVLLCPGNASRLAQETYTWNQRFAEYGLLQKLDIGASSALHHLFTSEPLVLLAFGLLGLCVIKAHDDVILRLIGLLPFAVALCFGSLSSVMDAAFGGLGSAFSSLSFANGWLGFLGRPALAAPFKFVLGCVSVSAAIAAIYLAFGHRGKAVVLELTFLAGLASQAVIGFSPTLEVSGVRTAFFLQLSFAILSAALIDLLRQQRSKAAPAAECVSLLLGAVGYMVMCMPTLGL